MSVRASKEQRARERALTAMLGVIADVGRLNRQVAERLGSGVSDAQFRTFLEQHGPLTPGQLAKLSGLNSATVTGVLDRLERAGYARRDRHPSDRRKVVVTLDQGQIDRDVGQLYASRIRHLNAVLDRYDTNQLELIADFLTRLASASGP